MKIRSITIFNGLPTARNADQIQRSGQAAKIIQKRLTQSNFEVQTTRLALAAAHQWTSTQSTAQTIAAVQALESQANQAGLDYISIGPIAESAEHLSEIQKLPHIIAETNSIFATAPIAANGIVNAWALRPIAEAIKSISTALADGFGNLRFAAIAQCNPGIPFFPAAYAAKDDFSCALAIECADVALNCVASNNSAAAALADLKWRIETFASAIEKSLEGSESETGALFKGCDWSLAPHPDPACSIGAAIEKLSGAPFGSPGTLTAVAALTKTLKSAQVRQVGFTGVFLPLLEDAVLAERTKDLPDLQKLLLYCAVCGSGLDTIPLPGNVKPESIAALLTDIATLATTLQKPLTARLMPIPNLNPGEKTNFNFPYLINGHALPL